MDRADRLAFGKALLFQTGARGVFGQSHSKRSFFGRDGYQEHFRAKVVESIDAQYQRWARLGESDGVDEPDLTPAFALMGAALELRVVNLLGPVVVQLRESRRRILRGAMLDSA